MKLTNRCKSYTSNWLG